MTTNLPETRRVGTMVVANDGFQTRLGQVVDHKADQWGISHEVLVDGEYEQVSSIYEADHLGIGWKLATPADVARYHA